MANYNELSNFWGDPFNSDQISAYKQVTEDKVIPSSANYPATSPTRYLVYLDEIPDQSDLGGARPIVVTDTTTATVLSKVSGSPSASEYRLSPTTSNIPNVIEVNSSRAGNTLQVVYYTQGGIVTNCCRRATPSA